MVERVVLIGLSGTGKSTLATLIASQLGWSALDTDTEIERRASATIPEIFRDRGEAAFREGERGVLREALAQGQTVIATGGGAVVRDDVWTTELLGDAATMVVWLDGDPRNLVERLANQAGSSGEQVARPLLAEGDPLQKLRDMRVLRKSAYARADVTMPVDHRDPESIAADITELVHLVQGTPSNLVLSTATNSSTICVGAAAIPSLPRLVQSEWPNAQRVWIAVDEHVLPNVEDDLTAHQDRANSPWNILTIPSGEGSKSLGGLSRVYDWMLDGGIERGDIAVAIGGGVVGDLIGFAASSVLRGIGLVQIPTTLLAMVDSSVGGKTGINHAAGKNLIGTYYQPRQILVDPALLRTLSPRDYRSGWAEIIKHALIERSAPGGENGDLLALLESNVIALADRTSPLLPLVIRKNISLKASVVERDERESGLRAILNLGHTVGHGIEASSYELLHGEAVALGICATLFIARELGLIDPIREQCVRELISEFGLPTSAPIDPVKVRQRMRSDKKKSGGTQRWVLPVAAGEVEIRTDVPAELIDRAIESVRAP